jgi:signal transduction histidine kinase
MMPVTWDWRLVALSVVVSELGAYAAHRFSDRISAARGRAWPWVVGGGLASGVSTWAMHYIGMAGLDFPVPVFYDWLVVAVSYLPAALSAMLALILVARRRIGWPAAIRSSILMGGGIAAMHYLAMDAMRFRGMHHYSLPIALLSCVLPVLVVLAALKLTFLDRSARKRSRWKEFASILFWGAANPIMHYTAMAGTTFVAMPEAPDLSRVVSVSTLGAAGFTMVSAMAVAAGLVTAFVDRLREQGAAFAERLIEAQESERRRVARELHDEIGQTLTAIRLNLGAIEQAHEPAKRSTLVQDTCAIVDQGVQQVRDLSLDLRPPLLDDLGLPAALRSHVKREAERAGIEAEVIAEAGDARLPPELETACFRIAQEALTNVVRHSGARRVCVELTKAGGELQLAVVDDGKGFDLSGAGKQQLGLGLLGMRERAAIAGGFLTIKSAPGGGTQVRAHFPLPP